MIIRLHKRSNLYVCKLIKNNNNDDDLLGSKHISNFKKPFKIKKIGWKWKDDFLFLFIFKEKLKKTNKNIYHYIVFIIFIIFRCVNHVKIVLENQNIRVINNCTIVIYSCSPHFDT